MHVHGIATKPNAISSWHITLHLCLQALCKKCFAEEFQRYFLVSAMAFGIDIGVMLLMKEGFGLHYLSSAALGFICGIVVAYVLSIRWAFRVRCRSDWRQEFFLFAVIGLGGLCLNEAIMWTATEGLSLPYQLSKLIAAGHVFLFNFMIRKRLLFSTHEVTDSCINQTIRNASSLLAQGRQV